MHDQIIRQLYHCILHDDGETEKISNGTKELDCQDNEKFRDNFYLAASAAEENGFVKGFISAFRLFSECSMK